MSEESASDAAQAEKKEEKSNPLLGMLDKTFESVRKFLADQKLLKFTDELTYMFMRKGIDMLKSTFIPMQIDGIENVPDFKPAIICSIVEQPVELFLAAAITPRKVHFMVPPKMFEMPGLKPLLEAIGAYKSTTSQDDMEPVQRTMEFLNENKDLVAMIPIDNGDREKLDKSISAILKFAAGIPCPLVPFASTSLKKYKLGKAIKIKIAEPIDVNPKIKRDQRHEMASQLVDTLLAMKAELETKDDESTQAPQQA
ncbi:MAG TPA: hypothetical protein VKM55_13570 [Candidatus Lokiarchaeia archaeon]|nr:hypothetical protein [Candidatus Lokiarchaeia archaeon]